MVVLEAGEYDACDLACGVKEHRQMHVRIGVLMDETGVGINSRGKLQLLDVRKISGNKILVLRPRRLGKPVAFGNVDWPCDTKDILQWVDQPAPKRPFQQSLLKSLLQQSSLKSPFLHPLLKSCRTVGRIAFSGSVTAASRYPADYWHLYCLHYWLLLFTVSGPAVPFCHALRSSIPFVKSQLNPRTLPEVAGKALFGRFTYPCISSIPTGIILF